MGIIVAMGVRLGDILCWHPNTISTSYYYFHISYVFLFPLAMLSARFLAHLLTDRNETWPTESSCYEVVLLTLKSAEREATSTFRET